MREFFGNPWVRLVLFIWVVVGILLGMFAWGEACGRGQTQSVAQPTPTPKPTPPAPTPTATPVPASPTPKSTPVSALKPTLPELVTGDFKASVYRQSDNWFISSSREPTIDTTRGPLSRTGSVLVKWTGTFWVSDAGQYQFDYSSGSVDLYVDGKLVVAPIYLSSGTHKLIFGPIKIAGESVRLLWQKIG